MLNEQVAVEALKRAAGYAITRYDRLYSELSIRLQQSMFHAAVREITAGKGDYNDILLKSPNKPCSAESSRYSVPR